MTSHGDDSDPIGRRTALRQLGLMGAGALTTRRAHGSPTAGGRLERHLTQLSRWVQARGGKLSALAIDLASGHRLGERNPDLALNPASNMKLLTAAAALDRLGPNHHFQTGLYSQSSADRLGELVLRGNGDPSLRTHDLWRLANALANRGIRRVDQLLIDQSEFDSQFIPPAFEQQPNEWAAFRAPVSAIAVNRNTVSLNVLPGRTGQAARTWFEPAGVVQISGKIQTQKPGSGQAIHFQLAPADSGALNATLRGHVAAGLGRQRFTRRVDDPTLLPGLVLRRLLEQRGVDVRHLSAGGEHQRKRLTYHSSAKLATLVHELGKRSDNFYAEMLLKALATPSALSFGTAGAGPSVRSPASSVAGARLMVDWLASITSLSPNTRITNGSGLFEANSLSAKNIVDVLRHAFESSRIRSEFISSLSIGGVDGTLRHRFRSLASSRRIRAKTGTLRRVVSLGGYVQRDTTTAPIAFCFLVTGIDGQHYAIRKKIDATVEALA